MKKNLCLSFLLLVSLFFIPYIGEACDKCEITPQISLAAQRLSAQQKEKLPVEEAVVTFAPNVPPPITRKTPALVKLKLETTEIEKTIMEGLNKPTIYKFWTYNGSVPGPFIRVREGDTLELTLENNISSMVHHNIDLHSVTGPGGGATITLAKPGESKTVRLKMLNSGLYVYHCAAPPVADHVANGMYGLILVEPKEGMPKVDKEFYVMQSEFYTKEEFGHEGVVSYDKKRALDEMPTYFLFNGQVASLLGPNTIKAKVGDVVRIYFGNGGPNKVSSFHVIGEIFDRVYREGGMSKYGDTNVQTTLVPPGGSAILDFKLQVPGKFTLVDHAIFRIERGCIGQLEVSGPEDKDVYTVVK